MSYESLTDVLFEQSEDAHLLLDQTGVIACNQAAVDLFRLDSKSQLLQTHPSDFSAPRQPDGSDSAEKHAELERAAGQQGRQQFRWQLSCPNGETVCCDVTLVRVATSSGTALLSVWREVTESRQQAQQLALSQFTLQHLDTDVMWVRRDGTIMYVNHSMCQRSGYSREELLQMKPHHLDPAFGPERVREVFDHSQESGSMLLDAKPQRKDGTSYSSLVSVTYIHQGDEPFLCVIGQDVTEQKQQQQALSELQSRLENALAGGNVGLWDWNIQDDAVYISPQLSAQLGEAPDGWTGIDDFERRLHPQDAQPAMQKLDDLFSGKLKEYESTFRLRHVDGSYRWILSRGKLFRDSDGNPHRLIGVHVDITDRIDAEHALEESERKFRELAENIEEVFWIASRDGKTLHYVSPAYQQVWGRPQESLSRVMADRAAAIHEDDRTRVQQVFASPDRLGEFDEEYRIVRPDGTVRWIRDRGFPIRDESGQVHRIAGLAEDITTQKNDQRRIARELERNTVMLRTLEMALSVSSIRDLTEFVTKEARMLVDANQGFSKFARTNQWQQTVYGVSLADKYASYRRKRYVFDGSGLTGMKLNVRRSVRKTQSQLEISPQYRPPQPDDRFPPMRGWLACPLVSRDGTNLGLIQLSDKFEGDFDQEDQAVLVQFSYIVALAIERLRVEESLRQKTTVLEQSNQDLEQFAYVASHDLQEPLRAISGYCQFLKDDYSDSLDAEGNRFIDVTINAAHRMKKLIDALLQFSRVGREDSDFEAVDLNEVVADVHEFLHERITQCGATLIASDLPQVHGSRIRLTQMLQNLVSNAIKYRSERPLEIHLDVEETSGSWTIRVHDNGIGIPAGFEDEIFRVFRRLHDRNKIDGTGIGLAICKRIAQRHGGRIWVDSVEGQGSTFQFEIKRPAGSGVTTAHRSSQTGANQPGGGL